MKLLNNLHTTLFAVALATFSFGLTSCSDDDDDVPSGDKNLAIETEMGLFGTYAGDYELVEPSATLKMQTEGEEPTPDPIKIKLVVTKDHSMAVDSYPIKELVYGLYDTPEEADLVLAELEKVSTKMTFETKEMSNETGLISFDIDADDVKVELENGDVIEFDFNDNDQLGKFNNTDNYKIDFTLVAKAELFVNANTETRNVAPTKVSTKTHKFNFMKLTK